MSQPEWANRTRTAQLIARLTDDIAHALDPASVARAWGQRALVQMIRCDERVYTSAAAARYATVAAHFGRLALGDADTTDHAHFFPKVTP